MDESVKSDCRLEVSVSFGRFENDALSWEKWSSFSPNKYLDEAGSSSARGSVAQKKAYFEAHYKKIAAQISEQVELEKSIEPLASSRDKRTIADHLESSSEMDAEFESCNREKSGGEVAQKTIVDEAKEEDKSATVVGDGVCRNSSTDVTILEEDKEKACTVEGLQHMDEGAKKELDVHVAENELTVGEEAAPVEEEFPRKDSEAEHLPERNITALHLTEPRKRSSNFNAGNANQKVPQTKMERRVSDTKPKVASPAVKHSQISTPKYSKAPLISTPLSASLTVKKKVNRSMVVESKRAAPTSLHMSLSLGPAKSTTPSVTRKSLIMEKMGDKDIVKRAFKSFQSQINGYPTDKTSNTLKQVTSTVSEMICPSLTPQKESKGRSCKSSGMDKRSTTVISPSIGLKSDERGEKRKEFLRKLEAKSVAREAENAQHSAKSKEGKTSEIIKLRQKSQL